MRRWESALLSEKKFLLSCSRFRDSGFVFIGLQCSTERVIYVFQGEGSIKKVEQLIEDDAVRSIAQLFPLADFPERQMYRDRGVKAIGNINLMPREES